MSLTGQTDLFSQTDSPMPGGPGAARPRHRRGVFRALLAAAVLVPVVAVGSAASATPAETKAQLRAKLAKTQKEAEVATERFLAAEGQLDSINVRVAAAKDRQKTQQKAVEAAQRALGLIAAETYRAGDLAALGVFLGDNPEGLLAQSGMMVTLGDRQVAAVADLQAAERQLAADNADLLAQQQRLAKTARDAKATKKQADAKNTAAKKQLDRFTATEIAAINASRSGVRSNLKCGDIVISAPNAAVRKAINYACSKIGSPYVYGAEGPNSFDCSGLTQAAYRSAGVTLPRTAAEQSRAGTRVSASNRQAGDLIFFYGSSNPSHVGIYIGSGMMIHAPHSGDHVRIASDRSSSISAVARVA